MISLINKPQTPIPKPIQTIKSDTTANNDLESNNSIPVLATMLHKQRWKHIFDQNLKDSQFYYGDLTYIDPFQCVCFNYEESLESDDEQQDIAKVCDGMIEKMVKALKDIINDADKHWIIIF